ncbi:MAG TPA: two-component regulator propeller domain-containing protein [Pyrinomonadaceae bacterium]|nr:two-component regulator propeller domain-containing protein [Pyrinomonadaceae bacterium]
MKVATLSLLLLLLFANKAASQFRFDTWTTDNGLPQASVNSILQTRDGFLWFSTFGGLVRYDGLRFQVFNTGNTKALTTSRFLRLYEDREGALWVANELQGVTRYKDGEFTTYSTEHGVAAGIIKFREDSTGNLLANINTGPTNSDFRWTGERFVPYAPPDGEPTRNILYRTADAVWYAEDGRLRKFENGGLTVDVPFQLPIKRVFEDSAKRLWIAVDGTTTLYELADNRVTTYTTRDGLPDARFAVAFEDRQKRIWFGSIAGLTVLSDGKFTSYQPADGLAPGAVTAFFQDREGTVWAGSADGLTRVTERVVSSFATRDGLVGENVYPIYQDRSGRIWIGSWLGLTVYENGKFEDAGKRFGLSEARITALHEDHEGNFWIGTLSDGLYRIRNDQVTNYPREEPHGFQVRDIYEDHEGNVWFASEAALIKFKDESFTKYTDALLAGPTYTVNEDRQGRFWLGTSTGLLIYQQGKFTPVKDKDGFGGGMVRAFVEDADGVCWIGMYDRGLYRFKDGKFTHYTANEGLFDNGAFQILEDNQGSFWISCNLGVYRVKKSELNDYADGRISKITSIPYNKRDGMLNAECNGGAQPAGIKASDGRLWFPTQGGVAVINPAAVPLNSQPPPVVIESASVDTKPVNVKDRLQLGPGQTYLEIHYSGLSFINPELVKFKYRLEGSDEKWIDADTRRVAYYTHLPPGNYRFRVLAANRDGIWNEQGAALEITVLPQFWQTWWFLLLATAMTAAIIYFIYHQRIRILKRTQQAQEAFSRQLIESQEAERKRIAAGLHDNLGQHLIIIKNWASLALNFAGQTAPVREQLDEISTTAVQALNEVREIIYDLRPYQIETIGLSRTIRSMVEQVAASSGIDFQVECDDLENIFSPEDEVTFYRMIQESVSNIVKHAQAARAVVRIKRRAGGIEAEISDNGRGFVVEPALQPAGAGGFGLKGLSERVRMLGGNFSIRSAPGKGTTVSVIIERAGDREKGSKGVRE